MTQKTTPTTFEFTAFLNKWFKRQRQHMNLLYDFPSLETSVDLCTNRDSVSVQRQTRMKQNVLHECKTYAQEDRMPSKKPASCLCFGNECHEQKSAPEYFGNDLDTKKHSKMLADDYRNTQKNFTSCWKVARSPHKMQRCVTFQKVPTFVVTNGVESKVSSNRLSLGSLNHNRNVRLHESRGKTICLHYDITSFEKAFDNVE